MNWLFLGLSLFGFSEIPQDATGIWSTRAIGKCSGEDGLKKIIFRNRTSEEIGLIVEVVNNCSGKMVIKHFNPGASKASTWAPGNDGLPEAQLMFLKGYSELKLECEGQGEFSYRWRLVDRLSLNNLAEALVNALGSR